LERKTRAVDDDVDDDDHDDDDVPSATSPARTKRKTTASRRVTKSNALAQTESHRRKSRPIILSFSVVVKTPFFLPWRFESLLLFVCVFSRRFFYFLNFRSNKRRIKNDTRKNKEKDDDDDDDDDDKRELEHRNVALKMY
jgi:hypothetical protein